MGKINLQEPYQLSKIIEIISKEIKEGGFTDENYCLYSCDETLKPELICYLDVYPTISDNEEEVYPDFIIKESLNLLYYGEQFEDVIMNVLEQKNNPIIDDYILALNYYSKYDTFKDL